MSELVIVLFGLWGMFFVAVPQLSTGTDLQRHVKLS